MVVELAADGEGVDVIDDERRALHNALSSSWQSAETGRLRPASATLDELRQRVVNLPSPDHIRTIGTHPRLGDVSFSSAPGAT